MAGRNVPSGGLLRVLGVGFGIAVSIGNSIGSGIMRTPASIAGQLPSATLVMIAWFVGALFSLVGAWSLAEVAAMMPSAAAYYAVARRAFGLYVGFVVGWADWISLCGAVAVTALLAAEYARDLFASGYSITTLASLVLTIVTVIQWRGVRWGSTFQNVTSAITTVVFAGLIGGAFTLPHAFNAQPETTLVHGWPLLVAWVLVLQAVVYTYDGWYGSIYFGDEIVNPGVELPRSMINGVLLLSAVYLGTNVALFHALPIETIAQHNLPVAALGQLLFGENGAVMVRALMAITLLSLCNASLQCASRILFGMSRDGMRTGAFRRVNAGGTPVGALAASTAMAVALIVTGSFDRVLAITTFLYLSKYLLSYLAVFRLRALEPDAPRPYRAFGYPFTTAVAVVGSLALMTGAVVADTPNALFGCGLLIAAYPAFRWLRASESPLIPDPQPAVPTE